MIHAWSVHDLYLGFALLVRASRESCVDDTPFIHDYACYNPANYLEIRPFSVDILVLCVAYSYFVRALCVVNEWFIRKNVTHTSKFCHIFHVCPCTSQYFSMLCINYTQCMRAWLCDLVFMPCGKYEKSCAFCVTFWQIDHAITTHKAHTEHKETTQRTRLSVGKAKFQDNSHAWNMQNHEWIAYGPRMTHAKHEWIAHTPRTNRVFIQDVSRLNQT